MPEKKQKTSYWVRITPIGEQWDNPACKFDIGPFKSQQNAEDGIIAALEAGAVTAVIIPKRPQEPEPPLSPEYHELLTHLCSALNIDEGSFTVESLVVEIKDRIRSFTRDLPNK